jgi:hypothetical protein
MNSFIRYALTLALGSSMSALGLAQCEEWRMLMSLGYTHSVTSVAEGAAPGRAYFGGWCVCNPHVDPMAPTVFVLNDGVVQSLDKVPQWQHGDVRGVGEFDLGMGPLLHAWGELGLPDNPPSSFWVFLPTGLALATPSVPGSLRAVTIFDSGAGPQYHAATPSGVWRWNGAVWVSLGATVGSVTQLVTHDDGTGAKLFAAGTITSIAGIPINGIARWDGASWSALDGLTTTASIQLDITSLASLQDAEGRALFAGGNFTSAHGASANGIARWNGSSWTGFGAGLPLDVGYVGGIVSFDLGSGDGPLVTVSARGASSSQSVIAGWNGSSWRALSSLPGVPGVGGLPILTVQAAGAAPPDLISIGFTSPFPAGEPRVLESCDLTGTLSCFGDGSSGACSCGNNSASADRAGCLHSFGVGGAMRARGRPALTRDSLVLEGSAMTNSSVLYFQGASFHPATPFGDGLKCVGGPFVRLGTKTNESGASRYPLGNDPSVSIKGMIGAPGTRYYQARYRNSARFCTPETFNYTNAVTIVWQP